MGYHANRAENGNGRENPEVGSGIGFNMAGGGEENDQGEAKASDGQRGPADSGGLARAGEEEDGPEAADDAKKEDRHRPDEIIRRVEIRGNSQ